MPSPIGTYTPSVIATSELLLSPKTNTNNTGIAGIANAAAAAIDAASSAGAATQLVKTDASGNLGIPGNFSASGNVTAGGAVSGAGVTSSAGVNVTSGGITAIGTVSVTGALGVSGAITTSNALTVAGAATFNGGASVPSGGFAVTGNVTASGTISVTGAAGFGNAVTVTGLTTLNGGITLPRGTLAIGALLPFALSNTSDSLSLITIAAGDYLTTTGAPFTAPLSTIDIHTAVSGSAVVFVGLYVSDSGVYSIVTAASLGGLVTPTSNRPVYAFRLPISATGLRLQNSDPGGTLGYIVWDGRFTSGGIGSGGGTGGLATSTPVTTYGPLPGGVTGANVLDVLANRVTTNPINGVDTSQARNQGPGALRPYNSSRGDTQASALDMLGNMVGGNILSNLSVSGTGSSATVSLYADSTTGAQPLSNGTWWATNTVSCTSNALGNSGAGNRYLYADLGVPSTGNTYGFSLVLAGNGTSGPPTMSASQKFLATLYMDSGGNLYLNSPLGRANFDAILPVITSMELRENNWRQRIQGVTLSPASNAYGTIAGITTITTNFPEPMLADVTVSAKVTQVASPAALSIAIFIGSNAVFIDGTTVVDDIDGSGIAASKSLTLSKIWPQLLIPTGTQSIYPATSTAASSGVILAHLEFSGRFTRA